MEEPEARVGQILRAGGAGHLAPPHPAPQGLILFTEKIRRAKRMNIEINMESRVAMVGFVKIHPWGPMSPKYEN